MTNEYYIIPEPHIHCNNFAGRFDYMGEIDFYMNQFMSIIQSRKTGADMQFLILPGDTFHKNTDDPDVANMMKDKFVMYRSMLDGIFSTVGNHEISYARRNVFWNLVGEIESVFMSEITNKQVKPKSLLPIVRVVDELADGEVSFHFGHFGRHPKTTNKKNILISHNPLITGDIINSQKIKGRYEKGIEYMKLPDTLTIQNTAKFDYVFIGHLHKSYGKYVFETPLVKSVWRYLGSTGRTAVDQVTDDDLARVMPCIRVTDGKLESVEELPFQLMERKLCVSEVEVNKNKLAYEVTKENKQIKNRVARTADPVANVNISLSERPLAKTIFEESLTYAYCMPLKNLLKGNS